MATGKCIIIKLYPFSYFFLSVSRFLLSFKHEVCHLYLSVCLRITHMFVYYEGIVVCMLVYENAFNVHLEKVCACAPVCVWICKVLLAGWC